MLDFKDADDFKSQCGYDIRGQWYPRVTKIVNIKAKPALYRFYANMPNFSTAEAMKENSAAEGTLVHDTIEGLLTGHAPVIPPSIQASVEAFVRFLDEHNIQVDKNYVEYRLHHPGERYAGTLDAIATIGGVQGILDIKTSQAIYRDYGLQTSAYMAAMKPLIPELLARWILRIDQDQTCQWCGGVLRKKGGRDIVRSKSGNWQDVRNCSSHIWGPMRGHVEIQEFPNWENDFQAFLGAKRLWEWENEGWLKKVGYC
ncbi:MAG: hypothetical protein Q8P01_00025 [bacterium]|nr:hypothetical protein [bacterium]